MSQPRRRAQPDVVLLSLILGLVVSGWLMLYSASAILADQRLGDSLYFIKRQVAWSALGLALMAALSRLNYNRLREWLKPAMLATLILLVATLFSPPVAGARRWLRLGPVGLQPAELAKIVVLVFLADYLDRKHSRLGSPLQGTIIPCLGAGMFLGLIALEPDLGTPALLFAVTLLVLFVGGSRPRHLAATVALALPVLAWELLRLPYRRERLLSFISPFSDPQGAGYQLAQSLTALGSGGWLGKGLGASKLKLLYLPTPHTDFIFPIIGEELGLFGAILVLALFATLLMRGLRIARAAPDCFGLLLAVGISATLALQAFFNIAVSIGLLPTKGLPLPFFSYGGSSTVVTLAAMGILLNISRQAKARGGF